MSVGLILLVIAAFVGLGVLGWAVGIYNGLVALKHQVEEAWSNIDVILKQRHDELGKLIEVVKGAKNFEQETLLKVTEARTRFSQAANPAQAMAAAAAETVAIRGLFAVAEAYPDLKSNQNFIQLQQRVSGLESQIADRREVYNDTVNNFNTRIEQFPDLVFARVLAYARKEYFKVEEADKDDVKIAF